MNDQPNSNNGPQEPEGESQPEVQEGQPDEGSIYKFLVYGLSLPERAIRGTSGVIGGAVKESAAYLVPMAFRDSRSYKSFVGQMLEFMVNDMAGVPKTEAELAANPDVEDFVARKSVSTFIDLAGMATLHISPLTVMAIVSDVAHGSNKYLTELATELKREGVIAEDSAINNTADLLDAVGVASGKTADALDTPPLSVEGLLETVTQIRDSIAEIGAEKVMSPTEIETTWTEMSQQAEKQNVSLFEMSSAMTLATLEGLSTITNGALSTIRVTGNMFDRHIYQHYRDSLSKIGNEGIYQVLSDSSQPYIDAVWYNFSSDRPTITEDLVSGKLIGKAWDGMRNWLSPGKTTDQEPTESIKTDDEIQ